MMRLLPQPGMLVATFRPKGVCEREIDGVPIRPDGVHYSMDGGAGVSRWVLEQIQR